MIKEGNVGIQEAVSLIAISITVKAFFTSLTFVAVSTGTASWYMTLISTTTAMVWFILICHLLKRFPNKGLIEVYELSLGKVMGFAFSIISALYLLISNSLLIREFTEVMKVYILPLTPPSFIIGFMLIIVTAICFYGLEGIFRFARLVGYALLFGLVVVIILNYNQYDYHNLFPLFGYGIGKTIIIGIARCSFYSEVIMLGIFATSMQGVEHIKKAGIRGLMISGVLTSVMLMSSMLAFNYYIAQEPTSRFYTLSRLIHLGGFLQRLDPMFIFIWCMGTFISVTAIFYAFLYSYCEIFKIQDIRPFIIPSAIVTFTLSMMPKDLIAVSKYINLTRQKGWIIFFGLPIVALIIAMITKKGNANGT